MNVVDKELYYNPNRLLSYNRVLNFIIGERGLGKTYGYKKFCIKRFIDNEEQFMYIKRYKSDIKGMDTFFDAVSKEFPDSTFRVRGHELIINDKVAGWVLPLSAWQSIKSREFPNVCNIIYDEFLLEKTSKQRYMENEPVALLNLMDTVIRNRDNARVFCLSNAVSMANPYFIYFDLVPRKDKRFNAYEDIVVEITKSPDFAEARTQTRFGRLISKTEYGAFSLGNEFVNDSDTFVDKRTSDSKYKFSVIYKGMTFGIWVDVGLGIMYMSNDHDPSSKNVYALTTNDMNENNLMMINWRNNYHLRKMVSAFLNGLLRFDNQVIRTTAYEIFKKMRIQ